MPMMPFEDVVFGSPTTCVQCRKAIRSCVRPAFCGPSCRKRWEELRQKREEERREFLRQQQYRQAPDYQI